MEASLT